MQRLLIVLGCCLLLAASEGCEKSSTGPACVSGTVLGTTCEGAYLLQLDTDSPLGASLYFVGDMGEALAGPAAVPDTYANVVETFSPLASGKLTRGQQVFLQLQLASENERVERFCTANKLGYEVPQVVISGLSFTSCKEFLAE